MWPRNSYRLEIPASVPIQSVAPIIVERVCRTTVDQPGFCLLDLGHDVTSHTFRRMMVALKLGLDSELNKTSRKLVYVSAARFDQQVTTKLHRDGGPDESLLMLGYEPSEIDSELAIADFSRCAREIHLTPVQFLETHNPMFRSGEAILQPHTTRFQLDPRSATILVINNSLTDAGWLGVLHAATISRPDESRRRIINSTMLAPVPPAFVAALSDADLEEFQTTTMVRRQGYDKSHLQDDE